MTIKKCPAGENLPDGTNRFFSTELEAPGKKNLFNVFAGVFRQLKHVGRAFSSKEGLEQLVCVNHSPVLFVLQALLLDVGPEFFGEFGAR